MEFYSPVIRSSLPYNIWRRPATGVCTPQTRWSDEMVKEALDGMPSSGCLSADYDNVSGVVELGVFLLELSFSGYFTDQVAIVSD